MSEPEKTAERYGRAVAQMHNALEDFSSPHPRFQGDIEYFTARPLYTIEPFLAHRRDDWAYLLNFAQALRERLTLLTASELEQGFFHGDLQGYHANVSSDGTLTFYDFDCGAYGYRAYDLAVFLWCCRLEDAVAGRWSSFCGPTGKHVPSVTWIYRRFLVRLRPVPVAYRGTHTECPGLGG